MTTEKLNELKKLLNEFYNDDMFGLGEMNELEQIKNTIELVEGAIINNQEMYD